MHEELSRGGTVTSAIYNSGFNSNGRFYAQTNKRLGMKPREFKAGGDGQFRVDGGPAGCLRGESVGRVGIAAAYPRHGISAAGLESSVRNPPRYDLHLFRTRQKLGQPKARRAVAGACAANTLAVAIPCHRVAPTVRSPVAAGALNERRSYCMLKARTVSRPLCAKRD